MILVRLETCRLSALFLRHRSFTASLKSSSVYVAQVMAQPLVLSGHKVWAVSVHWFTFSSEEIKRCKLCARAKHVQCAPQFIFLYCVVMSLSRCANVQSLVSLAQKFTNSEDPMFTIFPSLARAACAANHWVLQRTLSTYVDHRPTKFDPCPSIGLACSLEKGKRGANSVHVPITCNVEETGVSWAGFCLNWHKFGMIENIICYCH